MHADSTMAPAIEHPRNRITARVCQHGPASMVRRSAVVLLVATALASATRHQKVLSGDPRGRRGAEEEHCPGDVLRSAEALQWGDLRQLAQLVVAGHADERVIAAAALKRVRPVGGAGVQSTPSFMINGALISGALPVETFRQLLDQLKAQKGR